MFYHHPYSVPVLDAVATELWHRQLSIGTPEYLSGDAGVLLDHLTERGLDQLANHHWIETHGQIEDRWFHWLIEDLVEEIWEYPIDREPTGGEVWLVRDEIQQILAGGHGTHLTASIEALARFIPRVPDPNYRQLLFILVRTGQVLHDRRSGLGNLMMQYAYQYPRWLLYPMLDSLLP